MCDSLDQVSNPPVSDSLKGFILQSADDENGEANVESTSVLTFVDNSAGTEDIIPYTGNPIASMDASNLTDLHKFLSRPVLIDSRTLSTSDTIATPTRIEPWYLFLNNSIIKNKLLNFAYLRAKLRIKIVLNATPFHFGLYRVAYEPSTNAAGTGFRTTALRPTQAAYWLPGLSQLPGVWINPADNSGGELSIPFWFPRNWLSLNSASLAKTMGTLIYYCAFPLSVASSTANSTITMDTFAWLEDVELCASTNELTLQSGDEYDGPISKIASAVAVASGSLKSYPIIGRFARASEIGASAVAAIAHIFGYTNTPVIDDVHGQMPILGHLATSEISIPINKLTLDPKQELSIDPSLHGLPPGDEMTIQSIVTRPTSLIIPAWTTTYTAGTVLFNANVTPSLFCGEDINNASAVKVGNRISHSTLSYLAMLYQHWRGDIIFDIDVICTKFHKGRLKISWDPIGSSGTTELPENSVFTTILDIGANNKASLRIPFHSAYAWLRTRGITSVRWSPGNSMPTNTAYDNGLFLISVLTPLTSPVTPSSVGVRVTVRGAENFEFANPKAFLGDSSSAYPPSFFALQAKDVIDIHEKEVPIGDSGSSHPERYALNFGEAQVSLRSLLHRQTVYDVSTPFSSSSTRFLAWIKSFTRLPPSYGYDPSSTMNASKIVAASGTAPFNYNTTHPITYVAAMYAGFRGSVNYTLNISADLIPYLGDIRVERLTDNTYSSARKGTTYATQNTGVLSTPTFKFLNNYYSAGGGGAAFTNTQTNAAITWNAPHMSGTNFNYTDPTYSLNGNTNDQTDLECTIVEALFKQTATTSTVTETTVATTYCGTGPDFHCLWWLCCPTLDYTLVNP